MAFSKRLRTALKKVTIPDMVDELRSYWFDRYHQVTTHLAIDFETTSRMEDGPRQYSNRNDPDADKIFAWQFCNYEGESERFRIKPNTKIQRLQDIMDDTSISKLAHNYKFEDTQLIVEGYHVPPETVWHDSMILSQLMYNLRPFHALDAVAYDMCGWDRKLDQEVHRLAKLYGGFHKVPRSKMDPYQVADVERSMILFRTWWDEVLNDDRLLDSYISEIMTIQVTQIMEETGLMVYEDSAEELMKECDALANKSKEEAQVLASTRYVNLNTPKDVAWLLYNKVGAPAIKRTAKGGYSTKAEVLEAIIDYLDSPLSEIDDLNVGQIRQTIDIIQRWRAYSRGVSIIGGYLKLMDSKHMIHPSLKTNHAKTGRESCEAPNLQNVSKKSNPKSPYAVPARKCFGCPEDTALMLKDQSGIELRLIIEAAQCESMMDIIRTGGHPHVEFCKIIYGNRFTSKKECKDLYMSGKNTHFALGYGAAIEKMAATAHLNYAEMEAGYNLYARRYPEIANLVRTGIKQVQKDGYITTPFGRRLYIPADVPYAWLNYMIQGMAAEIIKRGQTNSMWYLKKFWGLRIKPVMTIHDEIIFQIPLSIAKDTKALTELSRGLDECMTYVPQINVPLEVESKITFTTWDKAEEIVL